MGIEVSAWGGWQEMKLEKYKRGITESQTKVFVLCPKRNDKRSNGIKQRNDMVKSVSRKS